MTKKEIFLLSIFTLLFAQAASAQTVDVQAVPWAWYISRSSGLLAFLLLYLSIFFGVAIRTPFLKKIFPTGTSLNLHNWLAVQALILSLIHGVILIFDQTLNFSLADVLIPFVSSYQTTLITLGIVSFYLMIILIVTSFLKKRMFHWIWRAIHSLNIGLYFIVIVHALFLGTDLQSGILRTIFIWANMVLGILFIFNIYLRLSTKKLTS